MRTMTQHSETMMTIAMAGRKIDEFEAAVNDRNARIIKLNAVVAQQNKHLQDLADDVATLQETLNVEYMHTAGLEAQRDHLKSLGDKAATAWLPAGPKFKKSGNPKTKLRIVYEAAFDAKGRELGEKDPSKRRLD